MKTTVDNLGKAVINELDLYQARLNEGISDVYDDIANIALQEIKTASETASFKNHVYASAWLFSSK